MKATAHGFSSPRATTSVRTVEVWASASKGAKPTANPTAATNETTFMARLL
jgi:hypothetical protein